MIANAKRTYNAHNMSIDTITMTHEFIQIYIDFYLEVYAILNVI